MILTCPSCATRYMADAVSFQPSGREVRCARCGHRWYQSPPADLPLKALPNLSGITAPALPAPAGNGGSGISRLVSLVSGWLVLTGSVAGLALAAYTFRIETVRLWPPSASLYAALGLPVNATGLAFRNMSYEQETTNGGRALVVMGEIVNISKTAVLLPGIHITLRDNKRREIFDWIADPPVARLEAGAVETFVSRLTSPPQQAQDMVIRFGSRSNDQAPD